MRTIRRLGMMIVILGAIVYPVRLDRAPSLLPGSTPTPSSDTATGPTASPTSAGATADATPIITTAPTAARTPIPTVTPTVTIEPTAPPTPTPTATPRITPAPTPTATITTGAWPTVRHIYQIVFENHESTEIIGNVSQARYLNSLITAYEVATNYTAVAKPSQPNYLAMFAGSTLGVKDNDNHDLNAANLADQIEASGRDWRVAAQNYPLGCFTGASASGGADGSGDRKSVV